MGLTIDKFLKLEEIEYLITFYNQGFSLQKKKVTITTIPICILFKISIFNQIVALLSKIQFCRRIEK